MICLPPQAPNATQSTETRSSAQWKTAKKIGLSAQNTPVPLDRRISVAPMMDYTDKGGYG